MERRAEDVEAGDAGGCDVVAEGRALNALSVEIGERAGRVERSCLAQDIVVAVGTGDGRPEQFAARNRIDVRAGKRRRAAVTIGDARDDDRRRVVLPAEIGIEPVARRPDGIVEAEAEPEVERALHLRCRPAARVSHRRGIEGGRVTDRVVLPGRPDVPSRVGYGYVAVADVSDKCPRIPFGLHETSDKGIFNNRVSVGTTDETGRRSAIDAEHLPGKIGVRNREVFRFTDQSPAHPETARRDDCRRRIGGFDPVVFVIDGSDKSAGPSSVYCSR